jgi:hypothetical protein
VPADVHSLVLLGAGNAIGVGMLGLGAVRHFVSPSLLCLMSGRNDCYFTSL